MSWFNDLEKNFKHETRVTQTIGMAPNMFKAGCQCGWYTSHLFLAQKVAEKIAEIHVWESRRQDRGLV